MLDAIQSARLVYVALPEARSLTADIIKAKPDDYPRELITPSETPRQAAQWLIDNGANDELKKILERYLK